MKIKQSVNISRKSVTVIFAVTAVAAFALRMYQQLFLIDAATGFYDTKNWSVYALYALLAVSCAAIILMSFISKNTQPQPVKQGKDMPICIASIVMAVTLIFDSLYSLASSATADLPSTTGDGGRFELFRAMMRSGALPLLFQSILAVFAAVYFIMLAVGFGKGGAGFIKHKILSLTPVGWCVLRMIRRFVRQISFMKVSDLLLELLMIAFLLLFLMAFAQSASKVYDEGVAWRLQGYGLPAAVFCIITALPRLIFVVIGKGSAYINPEHPLFPCDIALAAFIIAVVYNSIKGGDDTAVTEG